MIGYVTRADKLAGRAEAIWAARKQKLATANARRRAKARRRDLHRRRAPGYTEENSTKDRATRGRDPTTRGLLATARPRGADVTWRMATETARPGWFMVETARQCWTRHPHMEC